MCNLKEYNKLVNKTNKKSRLTDTENKPVFTNGERRKGRGSVAGGLGRLLWEYMKSCV